LVRVGGQDLTEEIVEADDAAERAVRRIDDGELGAGCLKAGHCAQHVGASGEDRDGVGEIGGALVGTEMGEASRR
jgi:hypothetical protein